MASSQTSAASSDRDRMRALAHPVRISIVTALHKLTYARAADLAQHIGVPANALSYHLRILARGGIIQEAPEKARDRRDRVWQLTQSSDISLDSLSGPEDASTALALVSAQLEGAKRSWVQALSTTTDGASPNLETAALLSSDLTLSPEQATELRQKISDLIATYSETSATEGGHPFHLTVSLLEVPPFTS